MQSRSYTPTQQKILNMLLDGSERSVSELRLAMEDEFASDDVIRVHISNINKALPRYLHITCKNRNGQGYKYQLMKAITRDDD